MSKFDSATPYIACFVILRRNKKVAMVKRKNTNWMDGYYGLPAGKVEWGERFILGAVREAKEEAGIDITPTDLRYVHTVHRHSEDTDWIDIYFEVDSWRGEPYNAEEDKSDELVWLEIDNLPNNVVPPQKDAIERAQKGEYFSEYGWE